MSRTGLAAVLAVIALALAACGDAGAGDADPDTPDGAAMCAPDVPDCVDVIVEGEDGDEFDSDAARDEADDLLGTAEEDLPGDVRVGRRGDEQMMLTEDYVLGRHTVELDADDQGVFRVTMVITELPDGPETTTAE